MSRRGALLGGLALVLAGRAAPAQDVAEAPATPAARPPPRRTAARRRPAEPLPLPPPPPPLPESEHAPLPNRELVGPRETQTDRATLRPDFIEPRTILRGQTFQDDEMQRRQDRLFSPVPGARLHVPFSSP